MELAEHGCLAAGVKSSWPAWVIVWSFLATVLFPSFSDLGRVCSWMQERNTVSEVPCETEELTNQTKRGAGGRVLSWACQTHESSFVITFCFFFSQLANLVIQVDLKRQGRAFWPLLAPKGCHGTISKAAGVNSRALAKCDPWIRAAILQQLLLNR